METKGDGNCRSPEARSVRGQPGASDTGESRATNCSLKPFFSATGIYPVLFSLNASEKESLKPAHRLQHAARGARAFTPAPTLIICFSVPLF